MPWLSVRFPNAKLVAKRFERLRRKVPLISRKRIYDAMVEIRSIMKQPGKEVTYPIKWDSTKQRKAFFATDGFGHGIPTKRSGAYQKAWQIARVGDEGYDIGNPLAHSKYIGGTAQSINRQSRIHRDRWNLFKVAIDSVIAKLPKRIRESIKTIARQEGFKVDEK